MGCSRRSPSGERGAASFSCFAWGSLAVPLPPLVLCGLRGSLGRGIPRAPRKASQGLPDGRFGRALRHSRGPGRSLKARANHAVALKGLKELGGPSLPLRGSEILGLGGRKERPEGRSEGFAEWRSSEVAKPGSKDVRASDVPWGTGYYPNSAPYPAPHRDDPGTSRGRPGPPPPSLQVEEGRGPTGSMVFESAVRGRPGRSDSARKEIGIPEVRRRAGRRFPRVGELTV